jgi:hypothetical protein
VQKKIKNPVAVHVEQPPVQPEKRRPVHEVKTSFNGGFLSGAVWRNQNEQGRSWLSVSLSRAHKSSTGEWKYGDSFSRDELLGLIPVILKLHDYIASAAIEGEKQ